MSRNVIALYETRAEAEAARARLIWEAKAPQTRIIAKDTIAAIDDLTIAPDDAETYREEVRRGCHLLVAQVPSGESEDHLIRLIKESINAVDEPPPDDVVVEPADEMPDEIPDQITAANMPPAKPEPEPEVEVEQPTVSQAREEERPAAAPAVTARETPEPSPPAKTPSDFQVAFRKETVEVDGRPTERRLTDAEVEAGGFFQERVVEIAEMREEPVITKEAVVGEEVIIRKTVNQRTETIEDTLRRSESGSRKSSDGSGSPFFNQAREQDPKRR